MVTKELLSECLAKLYLRIRLMHQCYRREHECINCPAPCGCGPELREAKRILSEYVNEGNKIPNITDTAFKGI